MTNDRRTLRTQNALKLALYTLLQTQDLSSISVKALTTVADVSRSTFYLHFDDINDLYQRAVDDIVDGLFQRFDTNYPSNGSSSFATLTTQLTAFIDDNRFAMKTLENVDGTNFIAQIKPRFIEKILTSEQLDASNPTDYYTVVFSVTGIIGMLVDWLNTLTPLPQTAVANLLIEFIDAI